MHSENPNLQKFAKINLDNSHGIMSWPFEWNFAATDATAGLRACTPATAGLPAHTAAPAGAAGTAYIRLKVRLGHVPLMHHTHRLK